MPIRHSAIALLATALVLPAATDAQAQPDFRWEKALPAGSLIRLHNLSGNVSVTVADVERVEVVGIKRGSQRDFDDITVEVVETARGIIVCPMYRDRETQCDEDGFRMRDRGRGWRDHDDLSVDLRIRMPKSMVVQAGSVSGDVTLTGAEGEVRGSSVSGNVRMDALRPSSVRATSVSGDVDVDVVAFAGSGPLTFTSVSGNVTASLPKDLAADVVMRSVSGTLESDFPLTLNGRMGRSRIEARIGAGGRELEVRTVSGDVRLRSR